MYTVLFVLSLLSDSMLSYILNQERFNIYVYIL